MILNVNGLLMLIAFILLALQAFSVSSARVQLGWLGLAFWALALLVIR